MHVAFRGRCDFHPLMASRVASSPVRRHAAARRWRHGVQMPLVAIRWARRDDPVVLKRKKKKKKNAAKSIAYPGRFGKKLRNCCRIWEGKGKEAKERKKDK